jgi:FkbM family methyltransferase
VSAIRDLIVGPLRLVRAVLARIVASAVGRSPTLEPWFIRSGRAMARRSRFGGGLYWFAQAALVKRWRFSGHRYREVTVRNIPVYVDVTDASGRSSYFYGTPYEKAGIDAMITALKPGDVFIDVGAHLGYFSAIAARLVGAAGRVLAFEPHEGSRADLLALAARNGVERIVEIVPLAVTGHDGEFTLFTADGMPSYSTLEPELSPMRRVAAFRPTTRVQGTSLDSYLLARPDLARRVRCIKIDVQGAESQVLAGMARTLLPTGITIVCETTIGSEADVMLERAGFRRHRIERGALAHANFLYVRPGLPPL